MNKTFVCAALMLALAPTAGLLSGCETTPASDTAKANLSDAAQTTLARFEREDPDLKALLDNSSGYVVFPSIDEAGAVTGGAYGNGQVYEHGTMTGFASMTQGDLGLEVGAQNYAELIVFNEHSALDKFKDGKLEFDANVSAVLVQAGAAKTASFREGVSVFAQPNGGAWIAASLVGQKFQYAPTASAAK